MIRNKKNVIFKQREVISLSATFLLAAFFLIACKKENTGIGSGVLPPGSELESEGIDTFSLKTYTVSVDSVLSKNPRFNLLGKYNDPYVGLVEASFYTQFSLSSFEPDFGDLNDIKMDSAVLSFRYGGYYGEPSEHIFEIYEIDEDMDEEEEYYYFSELNVKSTNLVPTDNNQGVFTPTPLQSSVVGNDTVQPLLRIPLDTVFAKNLMDIASNSASNEDFKDFFKGLHCKVTTPNMTQGKGSVFYLESTNTASKMSIYYTAYEDDDTIQGVFDILITNPDVDFNAMSFDRSGTPIEQVINDTLPGQETFFAQSFQARAKVEFSGVSDIPESAIVHSARLILPISYFAGSEFYPSAEVAVAAKLFEDDDQLFIVQNLVSYNQQFRAYVFDVREYVQRIINKEVINDGLVISPRLFNTTTERVIFNGPLTNNKSKPKLDIVYTVF
jgi:hypothetical protein